MSADTISKPRNKKKHPAGLKYLFGTEAMERFSYYGMRAILVLYLTAQTTAAIPGLGLERSHALSIYAIYTSLVYLTPLIGGMLADRYLGARKSIFIGGLVMMLGECALMLSSASNMMFLYLGLALLILGNGFFKPNASTIVGELYEPDDPRRDGAFTIFYMGINVGAFFSPLVCGTLGQKFGYNVGFAAAAIGMLLGIVIFMMGQKQFGKAGFPPQRKDEDKTSLHKRDIIDIVWITAVTAVIALLCVLLLPYIGTVSDSIPDTAKSILGILIVVGALTGLFGLAYKGGDKELLKKIEEAKAYIAEHKAPETVSSEAKADDAKLDEAIADDAKLDEAKADETNSGDAKADDAKLDEAKATEANADVVDAIANEKKQDALKQKFEEMKKLAEMTPADIAAETKRLAIADTKAVAAILIVCLFVIFFWLGFEQAGGTMTLFAEEETDRMLFGFEVPASYFQSINPIFIVLLAPLFSSMWYKIDTSKYRFSILYKMVIALILLGLGFTLLYFGQQTVVRNDAGEIVSKANMLFLVGVYFLHTCGELCLSPVGLSFVTKLSPARMVSLMMGVWLLSSAIANYFAGNLEAMLAASNTPLFLFLIGSSLGAAVLLFFAAFGLKKWTKGY